MISLRTAVCAAVALLPAPAAAASFTSGSATASKFGTHEIVLKGGASTANPFDTAVKVKFTPPSGDAHAAVVDAFYDGGVTWRARVYVTETGRWRWSSTCAGDRALNGRSGAFQAAPSKLRGILKAHRANPRAWMTDDGRWFANISDTAYLLFHGRNSPMWREFVRDSARHGVTCLRAASLGGWGGTPGAKDDDNNIWTWNDPWAGGAAPDYSRYDLAKFQNTDRRLVWIFDHYPDLYLQLVLFGLKGYGRDTTGEKWLELPVSVRTNTMRYMIARWSAFPNLFWLIVNDMHSDGKFPKNQAFVREVGMFFAENEPWRHFLSTGPNRGAGLPFTGESDRKWNTYIYIEDRNAVGADAIAQYGFNAVPLHVFMGEDYYEHDHGHYADPRYFFRWLYWSWLLAGGSANYAGRWGVIHPYSQTGRRDLKWTGADGKDYTGDQLKGLDSAPYIWPYFRDRGIDLGLFEPNDALVSDLDGRGGKMRPKLAHRAAREFLIYHPNAQGEPRSIPAETKMSGPSIGLSAAVDQTRTARMRLDLTSAPGPFEAEWYRPYDGLTRKGGVVSAGAPRELTSPWPGYDVVLRLLEQKR